MNNPTRYFCEAANPPIIERVDLPVRAERHMITPQPYADGATGAWLSAMIGEETKLWLHQALALRHIAGGANVALSTGTASGKTLPFQTAVMHDLLTSDQVALVIYPQKALSGDQLERWKVALRHADLPVDLVAEITGDVAPQHRSPLLDRARIVLATPDVIHCWLMRQIAAPVTQSFLSRLGKVILDEAHVYEGVFGSNSAFFFRRLRAAVARAKAVAGRSVPLQFIAATATIANGDAHLERLTGCPFVVVTEEDNGAASHGLTLLHIEGPSHGAPAEKMLADVLSKVASSIAPNAAVAFVDSRQGVERTTRAIARDDVLPHRSGYELSDRRKIETALRNGDLRAVVATSTLELGIDVPQFTIGLTAGIPQTRKSLRQRAGRIGRSKAGVFAVIAPAPAFRQLGSSLAEFYSSAVEPSHLYLHNRIIQFQQARCLLEEVAAFDGKFTLPDDIDWPEGFAAMFVAAQPGAVRPPDLQHVVASGPEGPHLAYPLRKIGDVTYALKLARGAADKIGTIDIEKAMREAYPRATYNHMRKPYRVAEWRTRSFEHAILLEPHPSATPTHPMLRTLVNVSHAHDAIIEQRMKSSAVGSIAEICMGISESVEGYSIGTTKVPYREARLTDERMTRKQREFVTTGVLVRIGMQWFKGSGEAQLSLRRDLAEALVELLSRDRSIAAGDIRSAYTGIAMLSPSGPTKIDDAIVIFDRAQGGLRLTSPVYDQFQQLLNKLNRGAQLAGSEALIDAPHRGSFERLVRHTY